VMRRKNLVRRTTTRWTLCVISSRVTLASNPTLLTRPDEMEWGFLILVVVGAFGLAIWMEDKLK
jgi:hypothetical protein